MWEARHRLAWAVYRAGWFAYRAGDRAYIALDRLSTRIEGTGLPGPERIEEWGRG
jgi:hypothetical protein